MIRWLLLFVCFLSGFDVLAQNKIVFRDGVKRAVIKPGKEIGVTRRGEAYYFRNWKSICSGCYYENCIDSTYNRKLYIDSLYFYDRDCGDSMCYSNQWVLDSIKPNYIVLRHFSSDSAKYRFDTVAVSQVAEYEKSMRHGPQVFCIDILPYPDSITDHSFLIYAVALDYDRIKVPLDSIASFTFPESNTCSSFGIETPLIALVGIVGGPVAASQEDPFSWPVLIVGESLGLYVTISMITTVRNMKVREYRTTEWKVKVK